MASKLEHEGRWIEAAAAYRELTLGEKPLGAKDRDRWSQRALTAYFMADRPSDAAKFTEEVLESTPSFHEVLLYLADLERVTMRLDEARSSIGRFLEKDPENRRGILIQGLLQVGLGELNSGLAALERYLRHEDVSESDSAYRQEAEVVRVRALRRLGRRGEAVDRTVALLEERPLDPVVLAEAAQAFAFARKTTLARVASQQHQWLVGRGHRLPVEDPLTLGPRQSGKDGRARLAILARDRREFLHAIRELRSILMEDRGNSKLTYLLADLYLRLRRFRDCHDLLDAAATSGSAGHPALDHARALAHRAQGEADQAGEHWSRAFDALEKSDGGQALPVQPTAIMISAADHALGRGDFGLAKRLYTRARQISPADRSAYAGEAWVALNERQLDSAEKALNRLVSLVGPQHPTVLRLGAIFRGLKGDLSFAARQLTPLIVKSPQEEKNFAAFLLVFGEQGDVPQVVQIRRMQEQWKSKARQLDEQAQRVSEAPLENAAREYERLGRLAVENRDRDLALDSYFLAAELDRESIVSLRGALRLLQQPDETFVRLSVLRRILERQPDDAATLELLAKTYTELDVRRDEAGRLRESLRKLKER